eukprot:NODE_18816_length_875_cov_2.102941.p1 GENE.NODE_18816_length_875_cov_2.102941~~NODE_18816_length_875_cov_2.102941.p1  ORF type:complete len:229 (+),score=34.69 NODE_18816_length_875_cov_2.102941:65-688(+)
MPSGAGAAMQQRRALPLREGLEPRPVPLHRASASPIQSRPVPSHHRPAMRTIARCLEAASASRAEELAGAAAGLPPLAPTLAPAASIGSVADGLGLGAATANYARNAPSFAFVAGMQQSGIECSDTYSTATGSANFSTDCSTMAEATARFVSPFRLGSSPLRGSTAPLRWGQAVAGHPAIATFDQVPQCVQSQVRYPSRPQGRYDRY